MELNYHAGIAISSCLSHISSVLYNTDYADVITAVHATQ